jgi:molecular chaperone GrpE
MSEEKNIPIENEATEEIKEETAEASEETAEEAAAEETAETETEPEEKKEEASDNKKESEAEKQLADMNAKYVRLMADFQNQKKRFEKEKADIYQFANEDIVKSLLEVIDNFERALDASQDDGSKFREGMEMIFKQLIGALEKAGVSEIKALGEEFDPNFHNAVMMEETDEFESNKVSGVMQKGYTLNSKVIRPSMVKVAQ